MPTFHTPQQISANVQLSSGHLVVVASDRSDTVVQVRPTDPAAPADVQAAEQTRIDFGHATLAIRTPQPRWTSGWLSRLPGSVDVLLEVPTNSSLHGGAGQAEVRTEGTLGEVRFGADTGNLAFDRTGSLHVGTGAGDVTAEVVGDDAEVTGSGMVRIGRIDGNATIKNLSGRVLVGHIEGDLRARSANGAITVDSAGGSVNAATANGAVRIGAVARGALLLATSAGAVEIGIRPGTAALLDVRSKFGSVRNELDGAGGPQESDEVVTVRARTGFGDVIIRRA